MGGRKYWWPPTDRWGPRGGTVTAHALCRLPSLVGPQPPRVTPTPPCDLEPYVTLIPCVTPSPHVTLIPLCDLDPHVTLTPM